MVEKKVMFPFEDGLKEIKVGDKVLRIDTYSKHRNRECLPVTKLGKKYIHFGESYHAIQFSIETGRSHNSFSSYRLWSSEEAYEDYIEKGKVRMLIYTALEDSKVLKKMSLEQLKDILKLITQE